jgi:hypothetical protein
MKKTKERYFVVSQSLDSRCRSLKASDILKGLKTKETRKIDKETFTRGTPYWGTGFYAILEDGTIRQGAYNWDSSG